MIVRNVPIESFIAAPVFLSSKKATSIVTRGDDQVEILATIHGLMKSTDDQITVKKFLRLTVQYALKTNEQALKIVNRDSVRVKSAAAVAEIQKVREILQRCGKEMQQLVSAP
jgi:hypothetical protein